MTLADNNPVSPRDESGAPSKTSAVSEQMIAELCEALERYERATHNSEGHDCLARMELPLSRMADIHVRTDGVVRVFQGDWLRDVERARTHALDVLIKARAHFQSRGDA